MHYFFSMKMPTAIIYYLSSSLAIFPGTQYPLGKPGIKTKTRLCGDVIQEKFLWVFVNSGLMSVWIDFSNNVNSCNRAESNMKRVTEI